MKAEINEGFPLITIGTQVVAVANKTIVQYKDYYFDPNNRIIKRATFPWGHINWQPIVASLDPIDPSISLIPRSIFERNGFNAVRDTFLTPQEKLAFDSGTRTAGGYTREDMTGYVTYCIDHEHRMACNRTIIANGINLTGDLLEDYTVLLKLRDVTPKAIIPEMDTACKDCEGKADYDCVGVSGICDKPKAIKTIPSSIEGYREIVVKQVIY